MKLQLPDWLRPLLGSELLWRVRRPEKKIYLTFDDGPVPEVTPQVLALLDRYGWKATFFCVGENVAKHPELYRRLQKEGHQVGNHSFNHVRGFRYNDADYVANVDKARHYIDSKLFRPPHGELRRSQAALLKKDFTIVMWDLITYDYDAAMEADDILKLIRKNLRPGSIVVFHDSIKAQKNVLQVLPKALEYWTEQGYSFGVL